MKRIFDCFTYRGEIDVLTIRLNELDRVVDKFVIVEADKTHSGLPRSISFNPNDSRISKFAHKIRHLVISDFPQTDDPWVREKFQRNCIMRGISDAEANDIIVISDADEIPRASVLAEIAEDDENDVFGVKLALSYFYVNYRNVLGPDAGRIWTVATTRRKLNYIIPDSLRLLLLNGSLNPRVFTGGGWHFSYLGDKEAIKQKIIAFAHQEFNTSEFTDSIDIDDIISNGKDLFNRPGFGWEIVVGVDLPVWLLANKSSMRHLFYERKEYAA